MKRKWLTWLICLVLSATIALCAVGCKDVSDNTDVNGNTPDASDTVPDNDKKPDDGTDNPDKKPDDGTDDAQANGELAVALKKSLKTYLQSDEFNDSVHSAATAQARIPLLYLRYVDGTFYDTDSVVQFRKYLNYINDLIDGGKIVDYKYSASPVAAQGWYGIEDYLYTWSVVYNQYMQWCKETDTTDESFDLYRPMVEDYILRLDSWLESGGTNNPEDDDAPSIKVSFGYSATNVLPIIAANLGIENCTPYCDGYMLSYYEKDDEGKFVKDGGTPNWVGFSGRPLCGSLYRNRAEYDVKYEKTMQGYFPFTDGWSQPLDEMVNLDRLCNYYNHTLNTGANVTPQYGLLYGYMNGIDMEHYRKEEPLADKGETGNEIFNVITLWRNSLERDGDDYVINNTTDMAVAIAYLAKVHGIEAPTPLGVYSPDVAVIKL